MVWYQEMADASYRYLNGIYTTQQIFVIINVIYIYYIRPTKRSRGAEGAWRGELCNGSLVDGLFEGTLSFGLYNLKL